MENEHHQLQGAFDFTGGGSVDGYSRWERERLEARRALAHQLGLPLDRRVRATIRNGIELRGVLTLHKPLLLVPSGSERAVKLRLDGVVFTVGELESWMVEDS